MANRIEGYDEKIIEYAQKEFLEKGYNDASLRNIAKMAGVSTSTMYTRFGDKEGMFEFLIAPTKELPVFLEKVLSGYFSMDVENQKEQYKETGNTGFDKIIDMIYTDYPSYKLIVSCSPGDTYKKYLERITAIDVKYTLIYLKENNSSALREGRINEGFCHVVSTAFYSALFHCVEHDMSREDAVRYITELRNFYGRGWEEYFK
ncbi:MAG: TetR/AcrR family transcriptional regulator [Butyrivibrio sp.]|uniref:TetR/AcrR family transcriptional regulator n=1 Tax=Butyrivibrio sp. TaxID=28121 RepID=UPI0025DF2736|nr:TetR/AcrR family transcriptional regulator [Butyrivibrio sp.]MCR5770948.1 TetR/AcrR family transcriptional regulator [Butyrivibrio sp.]